MNQPLKQWLTGRTRGEDKYTKNWIHWERKEVFRWKKCFFFQFLKGYHLVKKCCHKYQWRSSFDSKVAGYKPASLPIYCKWTSSHIFLKDFSWILSYILFIVLFLGIISWKGASCGSLFFWWSASFLNGGTLYGGISFDGGFSQKIIGWEVGVALLLPIWETLHILG